MGLTSDRDDPRLGHGSDEHPVPRNAAYLVLSDAERAKGFVRPVRRSYRHVGPPSPRYPLRDLTNEERERYDGNGYVKFEEYPPGESAVFGQFWTRAQIEGAGRGCGNVTTMGLPIAETYSANPSFYGSTYCAACMRHRPVGPHGEFTWLNEDGSDTGERVGT